MLGLDSLESRRITHVVETVQKMSSDDCHPAFLGLFKKEQDGSVTSTTTFRTAMGKRRMGIYGRDTFNAWAGDSGMLGHPRPAAAKRPDNTGQRSQDTSIQPPLRARINQ